MSLLRWALVLLLWPAVAMAQTQIVSPPPVTGFGQLAVTGSSAALSSELTTGPSSAAWPPPSGAIVYIINPASSGGTIYACPFGGACTTSVGVPIPAGTAYGFFKIATAVTLIGSGSLTAGVQW